MTIFDIECAPAWERGPHITGALLAGIGINGFVWFFFPPIDIRGASCGCAPETLHLFSAPAIPAAHGFYEECMKGGGVQFSLDFMKHCPVGAFWKRGLIWFARHRRVAAIVPESSSKVLNNRGVAARLNYFNNFLSYVSLAQAISRFSSLT